MNEIRSIPTVVGAKRYRSRLEARWGIFFDRVGFDAHHEFEGFQLPSGWYLPDFYLPNLKTWIEIKPAEPTDKERQLCAELCTATQQRVILFHGPLGWWFEWGTSRYLGGGSEAYTPGPDGTHHWDNRYTPCICPCGRPGIEFEGRSGRICVRSGCGEGVPGSRGSQTAEIEIIQSAVEYANSYRFWNPRE